jgi:hypothetical protein
MPRKDPAEIRALLEDALTREAQNPEQYAHLLVSLGVTEGARPTYAELLVAQLLQRAINDGEMKAIVEILDRLLGKSVQHTEVKTQLSYADFLLASVDAREKKELGIIDITPEPVDRALPPKQAARKKLPAPAYPKKNDPMEDLL